MASSYLVKSRNQFGKVQPWKFVLAGLAWLIFSTPGQAQDRSYTVVLSYDGQGRVHSIEHPGTGAVQSYTYNSLLGHDTVAYNGQNVVANTSYDSGGKVDKVDVAAYAGLPNGQVDYNHDRLNRLAALKVSLSGTRYHASSITYNNWGLVQQVNRNDDGTTRNFSYTYNTRGELSRMSIGGLSSVNYSYDNRGNLNSRGGLDQSGFFLPALTQTNFDSDNQRADWIYDLDGKLKEDDRFKYSYGDMEQLESLRDGQSDEILAHYLYDGMGERVRETYEDRVVYTIRNHGGQIISREIHQTQLDGTMTVTHKDYLYHNDRVLCTVTRHPDGEETRQYSYRDRMGNPALVLDEENGFATRYHEYSPYGFDLFSQPDGWVTHEFTGHERDEVSSLDYMHARYYSRDFGRFTKPDPAFDFNPLKPQSFNLYNYVHNDPVNALDPNGLQEQSMTREFAGAIRSQIGRVNSRLRFFESHNETYGGTKFSSSFGGKEIGGYVYFNKGFSSWFEKGKFKLSKANIRVPLGQEPEPGLFSGNQSGLENSDKVAAVIIARPQYTTAGAIDGPAMKRYKSLAKALKAPVIVITQPVKYGDSRYVVIEENQEARIFENYKEFEAKYLGLNSKKADSNGPVEDD